MKPNKVLYYDHGTGIWRARAFMYNPGFLGRRLSGEDAERIRTVKM
jgi:hypothetical protein